MSGAGNSSGGVGTTTRREGLGGTELTRTAETAVAGMAETAKAQILAHFQLALARPRSLEIVREKLQADCKRRAFAEKSRYELPRGGGSSKVAGWNIRFAEAAARALGNIGITTTILYEDDVRRIVRVTVVDFETNRPESEDVSFSKTIERRKVPVEMQDQVLGSRVNSEGQMVYLLYAPESELLMKQNALTSRAKRNLILHMVPADLLEEAQGWVAESKRSAVKADPAGAMRRVLDSFATLSVSAAMLQQYLGHEVATCTPDEIEELGSLYLALESQDVTWREVMEERRAARQAAGSAADGEGAPAANPPPAAAPTSSGKVAAALQKGQARRQAAQERKAQKESAEPKAPAATEPAEEQAPPPDRPFDEPEPEGDMHLEPPMEAGPEPDAAEKAARATMIYECNLHSHTKAYQNYLRLKNVTGPGELPEDRLREFHRMLHAARS